METIELEYYDRITGYHGIGTFVCVNDLPITNGTKFIVPSAEYLKSKGVESTSNRTNWHGCCEGREKHSAYLKPIVLICNGATEQHVIAKGHGAWRKDLCYMELE